MIWLAALLAAVTIVYLFSCWQVNRAVRDYYRLKAEWDQENVEFLERATARIDGEACGNGS